jgi:hypothetical protein
MEIGKEIKKIKDISQLEEIIKQASLQINKLDKAGGLWYIGQDIVLKDTPINRQEKFYGQIGKIFTLKKDRVMAEFEDGQIYSCPKRRIIGKK